MDSTRFTSASSQYANATITRTTQGAMTFGGRFYLHSLPASGQLMPIISLAVSGSGWTVYVDDAGHLQIHDYNGPGDSSPGAATLSINTWYYLWIISAPTEFGAVIAFLDASTSNDTFVATGVDANPLLEFATDQGPSGTDRFGNVSLCGWKGWAKVKDEADAATEDADHEATDTTGLIGEWFFDGTDITDHHSSGNNLTATNGPLTAGPASPIDGGDVLLTPSGFGLAVSQGTVLFGTVIQPSGFGLAVSQGDMDVRADVTVFEIPGYEPTVSLGTPTILVGANVTVGVSGFELNVGQGTPVVANDNILLTPVGFALSITRGTPQFNSSTGQARRKRMVGVGIGVG